MNEDDLEVGLQELCSITAPAGFERPVMDQLAGRWGRPMQIDALGNLVLRVGGQGRRVLVHAHADQVGYVVGSITNDGFLMLDTAQGNRGLKPEQRWPVGHDVRVRSRAGDWTPGLIAAASGHVMRNAQEDRGLTWGGFWVDLGARTRDEVERAGIHIGAPIVFDSRPRRLGRGFVSCGLDDRVGLCVMDALLREVTDSSLNCELWYAVTVQEESGMWGAAAVGKAQQWDGAIGLEVGLVGDMPGIDERVFPGRLGAGPMIVHKDGMIIYDRALGEALFRVADGASVPVQDAAFSHYGTDGIPLFASGTPAALLAVPTRYTHTAFEMVDLGDVGDTVRLLKAYVTS